MSMKINWIVFLRADELQSTEDNPGDEVSTQAYPVRPQASISIPTRTGKVSTAAQIKLEE
jgi:hypothetical protein